MSDFVTARDAAALDLLERARKGPVHFMGVCGAGMSALAEYVARSGGRATGCDTRPADAPPALSDVGMDVLHGHDPSHVDGAQALVVTAAVPADHPELEAARALGIPVLKRAAALGALVNPGRVVAVSGTHGKTTTTALIATVLDEAGLNPTAFVGGRVPAWKGGLRVGGELFVVEADEYDRSFLSLRPQVAVVTTLEPDHMEVYGDMAALQAAFVEFLAAVPGEGLIVACVDDAGVAELVETLPSDRVMTYGTDSVADIWAEAMETGPDGTKFRVTGVESVAGEYHLPVPGRHNVRNALAAVAVAGYLGVDPASIRKGLAAFRGVERRFQVLGQPRGVTVIDDYAHHPTEVEVTLEAARDRFGERRLVAVFQPHLYSRTRDQWRAFGRTLAAADVVWVTDVYPAREAPIEGVTGELVAGAARQAGARVVYRPEVEGLEDALLEALRPGDVCLLMGAGDIHVHAHALVDRLNEEAA